MWRINNYINDVTMVAKKIWLGGPPKIELNVYARVLLIFQFDWMVGYFSMMHGLGSRKTNIDAYYNKIISEQNIQDVDLDIFLEKYPEFEDRGFSDVLIFLKNELISHTEVEYCRSAILKMALIINSAIGDQIIDTMIRRYMRDKVRTILT